MFRIARNEHSQKTSKLANFTPSYPSHKKSIISMHFTRNIQVPFICSLNTNFWKHQNQLDGCPTSAESHYKCKQYIAVYNCQNMLKSLAFIRYLFSSAKRRPKGSSALSSRVRNIPTLHHSVANRFCIADAIYQKEEKALMISTMKNGSISQYVLKQLRPAKAPSLVPYLESIISCLKLSKQLGMRGFMVYFGNGGISRLSRCKIRNPTILAQLMVISKLLKHCNAHLCHNPYLVNKERENKRRQENTNKKKPKQ